MGKRTSAGTGKFTGRLGAVLALALVAALGSAAPAAAQDGFDDWDDDGGDESQVDRTRDSLYVSLRGSYAIDHFDGSTFAGGGRTFDRKRIQNSFGADGRLGYRFGGSFAVEGEVEWLHSFDLNETAFLNGQFAQTRTAKYTGFANTLNGRFYLLPGQFQPYLVAGGGFLYMRQRVQTPFTQPYKVGNPPSPLQNRHDWGPMARGGLGFDLYGFENDAIAFSVEGSYAAGFADVEDYRWVSVQAGMTFRW